MAGNVSLNLLATKILNTMKKFILIFISSFSFAQVAVGKTTVTNSSVSLEFAPGAKGIILPYVEDTSNITQPGTFFMDVTDSRIKLRTDAGLFDYSAENKDAAYNGSVDLAPQNGLTERSQAKTSIGTPTDVDGVLVLEDADKAMILPQIVAPELNVVNPSAGMIIYDPARKMLCMFNGKVWSYWEGVNP